MGQEAEAEERRDAFAKYQVNADLLATAARGRRDALPACPSRRGDHLGRDGRPASIIFDQSENRLHAQKALLVELLAG